MEQQNDFQSVDIEHNLVWNEESTPYVFQDCLYSIPGQPERYLTRGDLEKAWRESLSKKKVQEALQLQKKSRKISSDIKGCKRIRMANKADKELKKWANP